MWWGVQFQLFATGVQHFDKVLKIPSAQQAAGRQFVAERLTLFPSHSEFISSQYNTVLITVPVDPIQQHTSFTVCTSAEQQVSRS